MVQQAIEKDKLLESVTARMIILLHKGGSRNSLSNWRPSTLLNSTYKIMAKTLQQRLQTILIEIISSDQSAFLSTRFLLDNILLTQETIHHAKSSSQPLIFLKLDFTKAYDNVDLSFLFNAITSEFIHMTHLLFTRARACINRGSHTFFISALVLREWRCGTL